MARVKFSALVSEMRNKLNGSVFSKNRGGNYLRNKVTPVNPQSTFQTQKRSIFGSISSQFRSLTAAQVNAWNDAAQDFPYTDIFGDSKVLSGHQLHQKLNTNLAQINVSPLLNPPTPRTIEAVSWVIAVFTLATTSWQIELGFGSGSPNDYYIIEATPPVPVSVNFVKNKFRSFGIIGSIGTDPTAGDAYSNYITRFGVPPSGSRFFARVFAVSKESGQVSLASQIVVQVS